MSSPCPGPRFIRCRVRDLASCFYACRLPLEEEQPEIACRKPPDMSSGSIVYDFDGGRSRKISTAKKIGESSVLSSSSSSNVNRRNGGLEAEPHFAEEDYIVFCFREDGAIDMINTESKLSEENDEHENVTITAVSVQKGDENRSSTTDNERRRRPDDATKENTKPVCIEQPNQSKVDSCESSDSNLSDTTSTSSFAFPVIGIEWIGSPVHMPRPGSGSQSVCLHCCRF